MAFEDMEFGSYDKAERQARKAFELYENGEIPQALSELEEAIEINPSNSAWHFDKALALDAEGKFDEAISEYEIALQLSGDDVEILNSLAVDYTRIGEYDRAIETFEHIEQLERQFEPAYCNRIITYTEMEQHELAEQMFYLAQQINPDCALCHYNIGNSLFIRGRYQKAIYCWRRTAKLEPSHPQINYRIAQAYWSDGDTEQAREHFLSELRNNPGDIDVILDFGLFLLELGDTESAKEKFNRILELKPGFAPAQMYLGEIAFDGADYERSVELFNQALQGDNTLAGPRYRLAQYALMKGHKEQATAYLVSEVKLAPNDTGVLVSMASMFTAMDELDYAVNCLLRAVDIDYCNGDAYYYLGLANALRSRFEEAADFFGHTLDIQPKDIRALRDCAAVYLAVGRIDDAARKIEEAKALTVNDSQVRAISRRIRIAQISEQINDFFSRFRLNPR